MIISALGSALVNSVVRKLFGDGGWLIFSAVQWFHPKAVSSMHLLAIDVWSAMDGDRGNIFMVSSGIHAALLRLRWDHY